MTAMLTPAALKKPREIKTDPASRIINSTKHGIGRLRGIGDYLCISNIGKNFEIQRWDPRSGRIVERWLYDTTAFPGQDLPSLLDFDVHAFLTVGDLPYLLVSNHFGHMRAFAFPPSGGRDAERTAETNGDKSIRRLESVFDLQCYGDIERLLVVNDRLITTSPRGHETEDPKQDGIFISEPLPAAIARARNARGEKVSIACSNFLSENGIATALTADGERLAIAWGNRVEIFPLDFPNHPSSGGAPFKSPFPVLSTENRVWSCELPVYCSWLHLDAKESILYAAGSDVGLSKNNFDDWDQITGGCIIGLCTTSGTIRFSARFHCQVAWGYGSEPFILDKQSHCLHVLERNGALSTLDLRNGSSLTLFTSPADEHTSLGLGHLTSVGESFIAGFNRGGYRLFVYDW